MKRFRLAALVTAVAMVLSSCMLVMQGFSLVDGSVPPGTKTKARFTLRPLNSNPSEAFQFVLLGFPTDSGLSGAKATWGTNGAFDGPYKMGVSSGLAEAMAASGSCTANGLEFASITNMVWKAYMTRDPIATEGRVDTEVIVDVAIKVAATATSDASVTVFGVTGSWSDDGDGIINAADGFFCGGMSSLQLYVE